MAAQLSNMFDVLSLEEDGKRDDIPNNIKTPSATFSPRISERTSTSLFHVQHTHKFCWNRYGKPPQSKKETQYWRNGNRLLTLFQLQKMSCLRCNADNTIKSQGESLVVYICYICSLCAECGCYDAHTPKMQQQTSTAFLPTPAEVEVVIYHRDCRDGFGAAWCAWRMFGKRVAFYGAKHGDAPPAFINGKVVAIFDYCYARDRVEKLLTQCKGLLIMDHHKSALEDLKGLSPNIYFDMTRSGARLAWDYFFPRKQAPKFLEYIEDRDLWIWRHPESQPFASYMEMVPFEFEEFDRFLNEKYLAETVKQGEGLQRYQNSVITRAAHKACPKSFLGYSILILNCTHLVNEVGNELAIREGCDFAMLWSYEHFKNFYQISLRGNGSADLSLISKKFGGGGHPKAAAFRWYRPIEDLLRLGENCILKGTVFDSSLLPEIVNDLETNLNTKQIKK